ncbi:MAG: gliding motility-associated ABC transporter ATP-binding subunit GldA [Bacteroidales bacterium]|nr:gliding motility-associated ABC transporter ATP-binding subunit GldA [Bacteroidales bacterium]
MSIQLSHIQKSYGTQKVLRDLNIEIAKGEIVAFLGPNGAGKSTTMKIMTGLLRADSGSVSVCGFDIEKDLKEVKRRIGYLPENNPLYLDMYVREYLEFVAGFYKINGEIRSRVDELVQQIGLAPEAHKRIGQLSKGYRQRVGLAQALIHNPEVLILDEPTTGLDPNQIIEIRNFIKEFAKERTVILSTHILQEAAAMCDRALIIHNGEIVADKSTKELQTNLSLQTYEVEFSAPINAAALQQLADITSIEEVSETHFILHCEKDVRETLFHFAVNQGWVIFSIQRREQSLEEVFGMLTK